MEAPGNAEGGGAREEGTTVADVEHYHDTPRYCPLLGSHETAALAWGRDFREVNWDLSGADLGVLDVKWEVRREDVYSNRNTIDDTADNEHGDVL